ncbi:MAG: YgjV family protein [Clostridia bacterium]|nr:YgjV family protein [Clostridia bacterium]MBQ9749039.1 YgjV family protein [Clostridia bacterium]
MKEMIEFFKNNPDYIISVFTTLAAICSLQFKSMKVIIITQLMTNALLGIQCIVGGTLSASGIVFLAAAQSLISFIFSSKKIRFPIWLTILFMLGYTTVTILTFATPFDILAMLAAWTFALSIVQEHSYICRIFSVINSILWLVYDAFVLPSSILTHSIVLIFAIVGIIRNDRKEWKAILSNISAKSKR